MRKDGKLHICVGASAGGHLTELLKLARSWEPYSAFYVSTLPIVADELKKLGRAYIIGECNREHPFRAMVVFFRSIRVVIKERPDVVLTTGSLPLALLCVIAKCFGAKIVWIDSITNVEKLSMSGRLVRRFGDLVIAQWPHLRSKYRNIEYVGAIV